MTGAGPLSFLSSMGADLSLTCATFFNLAPPSMLLSRAPCVRLEDKPCPYISACWCLLCQRLLSVACSEDLQEAVAAEAEDHQLLVPCLVAAVEAGVPALFDVLIL